MEQHFYLKTVFKCIAMLRIFNMCVVKPDITVLNTLLPKVVLLLVSVICNTVLSCLSVPQEM